MFFGFQKSESVIIFFKKENLVKIQGSFSVNETRLTKCQNVFIDDVPK